jgi:hypothetical protein
MIVCELVLKLFIKQGKTYIVTMLFFYMISFISYMFNFDILLIAIAPISFLSWQMLKTGTDRNTVTFNKIFNIHPIPFMLTKIAFLLAFHLIFFMFFYYC